MFTPKNLAVGMSLSGTELRGNEGRTQVIDLYEAFMDNAQSSMQDEWEIALHGEGTQAGGRQMVGIGGALPIIPTAGTYGGISRTEHAIWQPSKFDATTDFLDIGAGWDSTTARPILENIIARRSKGGRYASLAIADIKAYSAVSASMVAHQRISTADGGSPRTLGFKGPRPLEVATPAGTVDVYCASGVGTVMPENTIYGIDTDGLEIRYMSRYNMVPLFPGQGVSPVNQDAMAQYLLWVGELVLRNPRYSWRLLAKPKAP